MKSKPIEEVVPPGIVVGGYRVARKLGAGGFGKVYLAWRDGRPYALKFIHLQRVPEWGWRELFLLQRHQFPNVVRLVSHVKWPEEAPEYLVLVMEYVKGRTLHTWAEEENPSARDVAHLVLKLARALEPVHERSVLHRDLKDDNVLVRDADGQPVLVDFGAGTMPGAPRATREALAPADLHYRSPESVAFFLRESRQPNETYDYTPADELYAVGVLLYELLTDTYPIDDAQPLMLAQILSHQPLPPHEMNERVPRELSAVCMRLLEKQPGARLASAGELCAALEALLEAAQGDVAWDVPLFPGWEDEDDGAQQPGTEGQRQPDWLERWVKQQPRRGKRPAAAQAPAPLEPTPMLATPTPTRLVWPALLVRRADVLAALLKATAVLGVLVLASLSVEQLVHRFRPPPPAPAPAMPTPPVPSTPQVPTRAGGDGGEVAPRGKPPEAGRAAAAPQAQTTPAAVASPLTPPKDTSSVKKPQPPPPPARPKQKGPGAAVRDACAGLVGLALQACTGASQQQVPPSVRPAPPPQECPARALKAMEELDIPMGDNASAIFPSGRPKDRVSVTPFTSITLYGKLGKLPG
ncbi:serine/threonine protein kinase, partial [Archangium sp.]|uniref:serine/threonine protein kinase n=1 Tax=Archangium sp. TaxID=1872627 RepID=UPI00389B0340